MAPNDDGNDPRRGRDRNRDDDRNDETNPFIQFRRFADSHVSSLLNTVLTLPATIANFQNVHTAHEQCLFGRADRTECEELREQEQKINKLLGECRDMYRAGDVDGVLSKGGDLLMLNHSADQLRKRIVDAGTGASTVSEQGASNSGGYSESNSTNRLVEKVANAKGQEWGWSWDWGFPRPFDAEEYQANRHERCRRWRRRHEEANFASKQSEDYGNTTGPDPTPRSFSTEGEHLMDIMKDILVPMFNDLARDDESMARNRAEESIFPKFWLQERDRWAQHHEQHSESAGQRFREIADDIERADGIVPRDAYEDLLRVQKGLPLMSAEKLGQSDHLPLSKWASRFWDNQHSSSSGYTQPRRCANAVAWEGEETSEEPSYEYGHDHEDQHDEPPSPKSKQGGWSSDMPETELEAYERFLHPAPSQAEFGRTEESNSVLSTLTTTERTVGPDGTVTTKVMLKKRFADGREESSETVQTHRGQNDLTQHSNSPSKLLEAWNQHEAQERPSNSNESKKSGWFWSN